MNPLLNVHIHRKQYGERVVLQELSLQVQAGQLVSLVGASGCGKSTLLRLVSGIDTDYDGSVLLDGHEQRGITANIGFIFQEPRLFPWLTVAQNVAFDVSGDKGRVNGRVSELLDEVGLSGHEDALPKHLSGGQAQRVAIARGLYRQPRLLLLDEPFSAVDAFTRMKLQEMLVRLVQRHQVAALVVTHDVDEAAWLADRVLVLDADSGRLRHAIDVPVARPREREGVTLAAARARIFEGLRDAHAF